jgi:hypothetical protein
VVWIWVVKKHESVLCYPRRDSREQLRVQFERNVFDDVGKNDNVEGPLELRRKSVTDTKLDIGKCGETAAGYIDAFGTQIQANDGAAGTQRACQQFRESPDATADFEHAVTRCHAVAFKPPHDRSVAIVYSNANLARHIVVVELAYIHRRGQITRQR